MRVHFLVLRTAPHLFCRFKQPSKLFLNLPHLRRLALLLRLQSAGAASGRHFRDKLKIFRDYADDKSAFMAPKRHWIIGMTMMELLCVIAIISILAAVYLGAIAKALVHVKKFLDFLGK